MKQGSSYEALELGLRVSIKAIMNFYQVDGTNTKFTQILDKIVDEIKQGKEIY